MVRVFPKPALKPNEMALTFAIRFPANERLETGKFRKWQAKLLYERFFVYILHPLADPYSFVFFLGLHTLYQVLFAQVYSLKITPIYLLFSYRV